MEEGTGIRELVVEHGFDPRRPKPPRIRSWPIVGSSIAFLRDPQAFMLAAYRDHGPVYEISLGPHAYTVIAGPAGNAFAIGREGRKLASSEGVWSESARITGADPHAIMTNVDGARHAELRGLFRAGMSKSAANDALTESVELAVHALLDVARRGSAVDAVVYSRNLVFTQLGRAMAGAAPAPMFDAADQVLKAIVRGVRVPILRRLPLGRSLKKAVADVRAISDDILASRATDRPTFIREVLEGLDAGTFRSTDLSALMLTPFIAGLDTMAHTLAFVLYRLARHPEWRARLRHEVDQAIAKTGRLDADALALCPELGFFVQEVMRIHPLSPAVIREAREDFALDGLQIEKGRALFIAHSLTHFMPEIFPDPHRFDPLRFHPDRAEHRGSTRFTPFGIGPHICLGAGTAEVLLRANTAVILRTAELTDADPAYRLRVSNLSGACPVGFAVRIDARSPCTRGRGPATLSVLVGLGKKSTADVESRGSAPTLR